MGGEERMRRAALWILIVGGTAVVGAYALGRRSSADGGTPLSRPSGYDLTAGPAWQAELPVELAEISGIAFTGDGRLFAHGDEDGTLWELDGRSGTVRKSFALAATASGDAGQEAEAENEDGKGRKDKKGKKDDKGNEPEAAAGGVVVGDFEDLAIVGERFFLVTSAGRLYQFEEGDDGARVPYTVVRTGLEERCEVEGLAHDAPDNALLLLCKQELPRKTAPQRVAVYAWSLDDASLSPEPRLQVEYAAFADVSGSGRFNGSAMAFVPGTRSLMIVAGPQKTFAEISAEGDILTAGSLNGSAHRQPEGLAFAPDGTLIIADEGAGGVGTLTGYAPKAARR
jgi:SdiA-regulated